MNRPGIEIKSDKQGQPAGLYLMALRQHLLQRRSDRQRIAIDSWLDGRFEWIPIRDRRAPSGNPSLTPS